MKKTNVYHGPFLNSLGTPDTNQSHAIHADKQSLLRGMKLEKRTEKQNQFKRYARYAKCTIPPPPLNPLKPKRFLGTLPIFFKIQNFT